MKLKIVPISTGRICKPTLTVYKGGNAVLNKEAISEFSFPHGLRFNIGVLNDVRYLVPTDDKKYSQRLNVGLAGIGSLSNIDWNKQAGLLPNTKYNIEFVKDEDGVFYKLTII